MAYEGKFGGCGVKKKEGGRGGEGGEEGRGEEKGKGEKGNFRKKQTE